MSFELKSVVSLRKGLRRIARKQMDKILEVINGAADDARDKAVHEARKSFKRLRALLRLVRPAIGEATFGQENTCFRDAGRPLSEVRDARVLVEALDKLAEHFQDHVAGRSFAAVREALQAQLRDVRRRVLDEQNGFAVVIGVVQEARARIKGWTDVPDKWWAVGEGLREVYRKASSARADANTDPTDAKLHEWRKQTKYLRHQLEVLRPLWPERMEELVNETDRMGELLGDDHDLAVLRQLLTDEPDRFGDEGDREVLLALIDRRRVELQQECLPLGERYFQDRPRDFARRLKGYWKTWRAPRGREQLPAKASCQGVG